MVQRGSKSGNLFLLPVLPTLALVLEYVTQSQKPGFQNSMFISVWFSSRCMLAFTDSADGGGRVPGRWREWVRGCTRPVTVAYGSFPSLYC